MSTAPTYVASFRHTVTPLNSNYGTRFRVAVLAGSAGSRVHELWAASNDAANTVKVALGTILTTATTASVGTMAIAGTVSITRTTGSFITDGWVAGQRVTVNGATTNGNDLTAVTTAVSAGTLSFNTNTFAGNENLPVTAALISPAQGEVITVGTNAGFAAGSASVDLLAPGNWPTLANKPDTNITLGTNGVLLVAAGTSITAGSAVEITALLGDY